jgi:hypothetical protein
MTCMHVWVELRAILCVGVPIVEASDAGRQHRESYMKRMLSMVCAAAIAVSGAATSAMAMPAGVATKAEVGSNVLQVQDRQWIDRRGPRPDRERGYYRRGPDVYYNGHRGSFRARPGWRRYNDAWFPPAAFIAGAIIGGAISRGVNPPAPAVRLPAAHVQWCSQRYRSYRPADNTFQPYNGPRRECRSPYF